MAADNYLNADQGSSIQVKKLVACKKFLLIICACLFFVDFSIAQNLINSGQINNTGLIRVKAEATGLPSSLGGTFEMFGAAQTVPSRTYQNLTLSGSDTKTTEAGNFQVTGNVAIASAVTLAVESGSTITLGGELDEQGKLTGKIQKTVNLAGGTTSSAFGGIGATITWSGTVPGSTIVTRSSGTAQSGNGNQSIKRYYDIAPSTNSGLNATLVFKYSDDELNNHDASTLELWKSTNGVAAWIQQGGTVSTDARTITKDGITSFSRWTAADTANPLAISTIVSVQSGSWNTPNTWQDNFVPTDVHPVEIANGTTVTLDGNYTRNAATTVNGRLNTENFVLSGSGDFTLASGAALGIGSADGITSNWSAGNIQVSGTKTYDGGATYVYNGSLAQVTGSALPNSVSNLIINNSSGVTLNASRTVNDTLTLTSGWLTIGSNNLTLGVSATISGTPSSTNMIVAEGSGELRKQIADSPTLPYSFTFPVGDSTGTPEYSPVILNFTGGTFASAYAGVKLVNAKHPTNTSTTDYIKRYWTITQSGISNFACDANFVYANGDVVGTATNLVLGQLTTQWNVVGMVNPETNTLYATGLTSFSDFTGGEAAALPIQLASFVGTFINQNNVQLEWTTISEINNYGFWIQKLNDVTNEFVTIEESFQQGAGYTLEPRYYSWTDENADSSEIQYRLKQQDNDGLVHYYGPITVTFSPTGIKEDPIPTAFRLDQNYPNPFNSNTVIKYGIPEVQGGTTFVRIDLFNSTGQNIKTLVLGHRMAGFYQENWNGTDNQGKKVASGTYFYRMQAKDFISTKRMIILK